MRASLATIPRPQGISSDAVCVSFSPSAFTFDTEPHNQLCNLASFDATLTPRTLIHTRMKCITSVSSVSVRSFVRNRGCRRQRRARLDADFLPLLSRRARAPARSGTQRGRDDRAGFNSRLAARFVVWCRGESRAGARAGARRAAAKSTAKALSLCGARCRGVWRSCASELALRCAAWFSLWGGIRAFLFLCWRVSRATTGVSGMHGHARARERSRRLAHRRRLWRTATRAREGVAQRRG